MTDDLRDPDALRIISSDASEVGLHVAGLGSRSYAFIIDWHIRALLAGAWVALFMGVQYVIDQAVFESVWYETSGVWFWVVVLPAGAVYLLYHPLLETFMHGRTPGKRMAGVRIVTTSGSTPGVGPVLIRNALRLIDSAPALYVFGLLVGLFTRQQVRIGDLAAGTVLVYDEPVNISTFDTVAERVSAGADLRKAELIDDVLSRWSSLVPAVRQDMAVKLLESVGVAGPIGLRGRKLDAWLRTRLREVQRDRR